MVCKRISTFSSSAFALILASGLILKPKIIALDVEASKTSFSLIAPAVERKTLILTPSTCNLSNAPLTASALP